MYNSWIRKAEVIPIFIPVTWYFYLTESNLLYLKVRKLLLICSCYSCRKVKTWLSGTWRCLFVFVCVSVCVYLWYNMARNWIRRRIAKENRNIKLRGSTCPQKTTLLLAEVTVALINIEKDSTVLLRTVTPTHASGQSLRWGFRQIEFRLEKILGSWCWGHPCRWPAGSKWQPPTARWWWSTGTQPLGRKKNFMTLFWSLKMVHIRSYALFNDAAQLCNE